jgi:hypothetical protein
MTDLKDMDIYARMDAAYSEISQASFSKDGTVKVADGQYKFIPIGQILEPVRKAHGRWGVKVLFGRPEYDAAQGEKRYAQVRRSLNSNKETTWQIAVGHIHVRIIGRSEEDCIELDVPFEAQDSSDKLTNKILTNAERCLYRTLYAIDEGDASDPEAVNIPVETRRENVRKQAENDPFFGKKKPKDEPKGEDDPEACAMTADQMVIEDRLPTAKDLAEATYGASKIPDSVYTKARVFARKWIQNHPDDEYVTSQIRRFGTTDLAAWPRAHVVDMANLHLESIGHEPLTYAREVSE